MSSFNTVGEAVAYCKEFGLEISAASNDLFQTAEALKRASARPPMVVMIDGKEIRLKERLTMTIHIESERSKFDIAKIRKNDFGEIHISFEDMFDYVYAEANFKGIELTSKLLQDCVDKAFEATAHMRYAPTKHGDQPVNINKLLGQ